MKKIFVALLTLSTSLISQTSMGAVFQTCQIRPYYGGTFEVYGINYHDNEEKLVYLANTKTKDHAIILKDAAAQAGICPSLKPVQPSKSIYALCLPKIDQAGSCGILLCSTSYSVTIVGIQIPVTNDPKVIAPRTELGYTGFYKSEKKAKKAYVEMLQQLISDGVCPAASVQ